MRILAVAWLVSSVFIVNLSSLPSLGLSVVFLVAIVLLVLRFPASRPGIAGVILAIVTVGLTILQLASHQLQSDQVASDMTLTVLVDSVPQRQKKRLSFIAKVLSCSSCEGDLRVKRIRLTWYGQYHQVRAGEIWQLSVRLKPPSLLRNTGGFDGVAFSLLKAVDARGYVRADPAAIRLSGPSGFSLPAIRQRAADHLHELAGDNDYLGLLQGLTVGIKSQIGEQQWKVLRRTGTAHLLAISGLHIGLVAAWALVAGRLVTAVSIGVLQRSSEMTLVFDPRALILTGSLLMAVAYAGLAGFELPTQRSVLMLSVWVIASLRFRFLPPMAALCVALIAVLSINALNVLSAGFWLSFGTVSALFYLHRGHLRNQQIASSAWSARAVRKIRGLGATHLVLGLVLLPVSAWFFQSGSLIAPVANLVAVPWVAMVCVPLSLSGLVVSAFSDTLAMPLLNLAIGSLQLLIGFLTALDDSTLSSVVITLPGAGVLVLALIGLVVLFGPNGIGLRVLAVPLFLPAFIHNMQLSDTDGFEVHLLDVGQGLAALVFTDDKTLLFDTGGKVSPTLSMFEAVVNPFLQASGRRSVDTLVVSHGDEDHAFGVRDVVRRFPDVRIFASQALELPENQPVSTCEAGTGWTDNIVTFGFLHPGASDVGSDNNLSCVLMIHSGVSRVLLTGDIEASAEKKMLSRIGSLTGSRHGHDVPFPVTLLSAPHHGSKSSSTQAFVDKFRPEYVVFPAGLGNRFGFPHRDVQLRYKLVGSKSFVTGYRGAISFAFGPGGLTRPPTSWWNSHRRFWHGIVNPDCWQRFADQSFLLRLLKLSQNGQILCGK
ncbi:MAG: DNA internalization-related competence protein ComEC/Rec2 [Granulosicoccus sp.]